MFAGGCEELDWTLSVLFDAMGAMSSKFNDTPARSPRAPMTTTATASSSPAAPASWCSRSSSTPRRAAPASMARSSATARPRTATTWWRPPAKARCAACAWRSRRVKTPIDYINPHATSTPVGDTKEIEAIREVFGAGDEVPADLGDEIAHRPFARRHRRAGGDLFAADDEQRLHLRERQYRGARSRRSPTCTSCASASTTPRSTRVLSNSFGFGGTNATLVLARYDA